MLLSFDSEEQILFVKVDFWSQELNICLTLQKIEISYGTTSLSIIIPFIFHFHERIHFFKQDEHCPNSHVILLKGQLFIKIRKKAKNGVYDHKKKSILVLSVQFLALSVGAPGTLVRWQVDKHCR